LLWGIGSGSTFTVRGRFFVVKVTHEVILDREHRMKPGFQDYVRYECKNDFPGRVEVLSTAGQDGMGNDEANQDTEVSLVEAPDKMAQEPEAEHDQFQVHLERQEVRRPRGFIAALFGRQR
jgi:hypothetical protein